MAVPGANAIDRSISHSDSNTDSGGITGAKSRDEALNPDYDVTAIRLNGFVIKVKNYFIEDNKNCAVLLYSDKILVKITVTNGRVDEYENLPGRMGEQFGAKTAEGSANLCEIKEQAPVAWLFSHNRNERLHYKFTGEECAC